MKLILVRHGETTANVNRLFSGHMDVALTEKGIHQATVAAEKLKHTEITKIYSSDLRRAFRTASIINAYHHLEIEKDERLREINFGACEGYTYEEIIAARPDAFKRKGLGDWDFKFPEGESLGVMNKRVMLSIDHIKKTMANEETVLVVAHAGVIRSVLAMEIARNKDAYWRYDIENCGIVELKYFDDFCMLTKLNG